MGENTPIIITSTIIVIIACRHGCNCRKTTRRQLIIISSIVTTCFPCVNTIRMWFVCVYSPQGCYFCRIRSAPTIILSVREYEALGWQGVLHLCHWSFIGMFSIVYRSIGECMHPRKTQLLTYSVWRTGRSSKCCRPERIWKDKHLNTQNAIDPDKPTVLPLHKVTSELLESWPCKYRMWASKVAAWAICWKWK
jgi:hypothetical protein